MKILFHINSLGLGGAERVVSILANAFCKMGYDVVLATEWESEREYSLDPQIKRVSVGLSDSEAPKGRIRKIILRHTRLRACIAKEKPDLVISFCVKANYRAAFSMLGMRIPLLVSVRNDPKIDYAPHKFSTFLMEKKAAGCVFQTREAMSFFSPAFRKKSQIIYNPLTDAFLEDAKKLYDSLPQKPDGSILRTKEIVAVGRITEQKNHKLLIQAFSQIASDYPDYSLKIYGEQENAALASEIQKEIKEKGLEKRIHLMPPSKQIQNEIADAAFFVFSSDYEGMPNSLLEALALGLPCISTDCPCGGPAMLIQPGKTGLLVPVGDCKALQSAMKKYMDDPDYAANLGNKARAIRENVKESTIVKAWDDFAKEIVKLHQVT